MPKYTGKLGEKILVTVQPPPPKEGEQTERRKGPYPDDEERRRSQAESRVQVCDISTRALVENRVNNGDVYLDDIILGRAVPGVTQPIGNEFGANIQRGDTYGVSETTLTAENAESVSSRVLFDLVVDFNLNELWSLQNVLFFSDDGPGFPEDEQEGAPPFTYGYRQTQRRRPLPAGAAALPYGITVKAGQSFLLGDNAAWKARPDAAARLRALNEATPPEDPDELESFNRRKQFADFESQERYGYNSDFTSFGISPPGDIFPPFTLGYAGLSAPFTADPDTDTLNIEGHGLENGDGPVTFARGLGELPGGIEAGTNYWVILIDDDNLKIALSEADALANIAVNILTSGAPDDTRRINGVNHWKEGTLHLPRQAPIAIETDGLIFEPFDPADNINFKVTTGETFDSLETTVPGIRPGQRATIMLCPQFWGFVLTVTVWVVYKWASPNHRIGLPKPIADVPAPNAVLAGLGAGNLGNGVYHYAISWETNRGAETRIGEFRDVTVIDNSTNGQVEITNIATGPEDTIKRHIYRTTEDAAGDVRNNYKLLHTINNNDEGEEFVDNVADGSLGATAQTDFPFPFGNSKPNDWFLATDVVTYDPGVGSYAGSVDNKVAGFYFCTSDTGEDWDDWDFCAADEVTPPSTGCFDSDKIRFRQAQAERLLTIEGYKQALPRPVFPRESRDRSISAYSAEFPRQAVEFQPGIQFFDDGTFTEDSLDITTDLYKSIVVINELDDASARRALCRWIENSTAYENFFNTSLDPCPYRDAVFDRIEDEIAGVDASFDMNEATENLDFIEDNVFRFVQIGGLSTGGAFSPSVFHYHSANAKVSIFRANAPVGSLVGAIKVGDEKRYIWRRTATTDRDAAIIEDMPFDSVNHRLNFSVLSGEDAIPRPFLMSADTEPDGEIFDFEF